MAHRIGVCGSCRARFQIPSTFTARRARCRTCGGVVEIGAVEGEPAPAVVESPEAIPAPAPLPEEVPKTPDAPAVASEPARERSALLPALAAAGVLALIVLGAWWLFF